MNRQKNIALFAVIAAIAVTTIGLTSISATPLMIYSVPQSQEGIGMLGHAEYTVTGSDGLVKGYYQLDNIVTTDGKDCVARDVFGTAIGAGSCGTTKDFQYIAIGNLTSADPDGAEQELDATTTVTCADSSNDGEMARKPVVPTITVGATGSAGVVVELEVANPFTFTANNATTVQQSGIFNGISTDDGTPHAAYDGVGALDGTGQCAAMGAIDTNWNMFSIQDLNDPSGIVVTSGDSLSVKWTITIGGP